MSAAYEDVRDLVRSPEFLAAWRRVNEEPTSFAQFSQMPVPAGFTSEGLWEILSALRRHAGTTLPFPPYFNTAGDAAWFSIPASSQMELATLAAQARSDSAVSAAVARRAASGSALKPLLADEVFSLTRRDGMRLTRETVRSLWLQTRTARSPSELLVSNLSHMFDESDALAGRPITRGLVEQVHERVIEGVSEAPAAPQPRFHLDDLGPYRDPDYTLGVVKRIAADSDAGEISPLYAGINISSMFWDLVPFEYGNALTELVVRRIHFVRSGMPALAYASLSHTLLRWEEGRPSFKAGFSIDEITADSDEGLDATIYHAVCVRALLYELAKLKSALDDIERDESTHLEALDAHTFLNERQKDVVMRAIRDPDVRFTFEGHRRAYAVVYATCRSDLLELVELGLLAYHKEGRKFVFQAVPHLSELLDVMK